MRASNSDKEAGGEKRGCSISFFLFFFFFSLKIPLTKVPGQDWRRERQKPRRPVRAL